MQVHATGRYNFNSLLEILKYDYNLPLVHSKYWDPLESDSAIYNI